MLLSQIKLSPLHFLQTTKHKTVTPHFITTPFQYKRKFDLTLQDCFDLFSLCF